MFEAFEKIPRWSKELVITEKIDGTNAQIQWDTLPQNPEAALAEVGGMYLFAGSRTRYIQPGNDNFAFAMWAQQNAQELAKLGEGRHYGEWWGLGIQRGYDLTERRFSLFNAGRWTADNIPSCVSVVPILYSGPNTPDAVENAMDKLATEGSAARPGFMKPEGVIIFHTASRQIYKETFEAREGKWKG